MTSAPRVLACGDRALTIEFSDRLDDAANALVLATDNAIARARLSGVVEAVPTYRSLLIHYDPELTSFASLAASVVEIALAVKPVQARRRTWSVPVAYGEDFGFDLADVAAHCGLSAQAVVERHASARYRVAMIGFLPGFTYLSGLDATLATPRRHAPRAKIPAGSIAIGGAQTALGSIEGPSGWHVIGRTPVRTFMPGRDPVVFIEPGDDIVLRRIAALEFEKLDAAAAGGVLVAELAA